MALEFIVGDLLECEAKYIAHQCNCFSTEPAGIAKHIFERFPYSNVYKPRAMYPRDQLPLADEQPGMFKIMGDGMGDRHVINIFSQLYPGAPKFPDSPKDGSKAREQMLVTALNQIKNIENLESIAFPWKYGSGLAGGDWKAYTEILKQFADQLEGKARVIVVRPPWEPEDE